MNNEENTTGKTRTNSPCLVGPLTFNKNDYVTNLTINILKMTGNDGVKYSSTRGSQSQRNLSFREVVMRGLAHDKGLFVPDTVPSVSVGELEEWRSLSFPDLAVEVLSKFVGENDVPRESLVDIVRRSCGAFREDDVTPVVEINGHYVLVG